jgi:hypothetical protein
MADSDEPNIEAENVSITSPHIIVNMGWSPRAVLLNNLFSAGSALGGTISVSILIWEVFFR